MPRLHLWAATKFLFQGYGSVPNTGSTARDHLANERTYLAWTRSSLALIALGIGLERFETLRHDIVAALPPTSSSTPSSPAPTPPPSGPSSQNPVHFFLDLSANRQISILLTGTGVVTAAMSAYRYYTVLHELQSGRFTPNVRGVFLISAACFGVFGAVMNAEWKGGKERQREH